MLTCVVTCLLCWMYMYVAFFSMFDFTINLIVSIGSLVLVSTKIAFQVVCICFSCTFYDASSFKTLHLSNLASGNVDRKIFFTLWAFNK